MSCIAADMSLRIYPVAPLGICCAQAKILILRLQSLHNLLVTGLRYRWGKSTVKKLRFVLILEPLGR
jgi:hypothetical protein